MSDYWGNKSAVANVFNRRTTDHVYTVCTIDYTLVLVSKQKHAKNITQIRSESDVCLSLKKKDNGPVNNRDSTTF